MVRALPSCTGTPLCGSLALVSAALFALGACRTTNTGAAVDSQRASNNAVGGDRAPRPAESNAMIRARVARPVPRCAAGEPISLASVSNGVDPRAAIARSSQGGMVAFVARADNGAHVLKVLALTATGTASGAPREIAGAVEPSDPAIVATNSGYVLAFRDHADWGSDDNVARERIVLVALATDGTIARWPGAHATIAQGQPLAGAVAIEPTNAPTHGFGVPALTAKEGRVAMVVARGRGAGQQATVHLVDDVLGAFRESSTSLGGGSVDWRTPPSVAIVGGAVRWTLGGSVDGASSVASALDAAAPQWIARFVASPSTLAIDETRSLAAYVNHTTGGATVRVRSLGGDEAIAPSTVAVYSKAFDPRVALVRLGQDLVGAITISQTADDATGSINLSLTDSSGSFIGRHAAMTSLRMRSTRVAAASAPGSAWVLVDGRGDDGAAVLGLVSLRCDESAESDAQELPSATMLQEPTAPDDASVSAERPAGLLRCAPSGAPATIATFAVEGEDVTADSSTASVVLRDGRLVFFARRRVSAERTEMIAATVNNDAGSTVTQRDAIAATGRLLDAAEVNGEALAVDTNGALYRSRGRGDITKTQIQIAGISAARFVRGGSGIVALSMSAGEQLVYIPLTAGRPGAPVGLALNAAGGSAHTVLDAVLVGSTAHALVGTVRSRESTTARALHSFDPSPRGLAARRALGELMADPISVGGDGGALVANGNALSLVFWDRQWVRAGAVRNNVLRDVRSVFQYYAAGGYPQAIHHAGVDTVTLTSRPGVPANVDDIPAMTYAITVHGADGAPRAYSFATPADTSAIVTLGDGYALANNGIGVVYARSQPNGQLQWLYQRGACAAAPAANVAASGGGR
ncbi:MAG: hypothetical protein U0269_18575 [Polyangiales bacterium]